MSVLHNIINAPDYLSKNLKCKIWKLKSKNSKSQMVLGFLARGSDRLPMAEEILTFQFLIMGIFKKGKLPVNI